MNDRELKEKIRRAYTDAAPDVWDAVLSDCGGQKGRVETMKTKKKNVWTLRLAGMAASLCLIAGGIFGFGMYRENRAVDATVSLDVNPSVEIRVNRKDRVLDVCPLNEDGRLIVGEMDFSGSDLNVTVNALIGSMLRNGYLSELSNSILISVDNKDSARGKILQEQLAAQVDQILQIDAFRGAVLSQTVVKSDELRQLAEKYGITMGKAQLIQDILKGSTAHGFDDLAALSINELNLLLSKGTAPSAHVKTVGVASDKGYIGKERAEKIALKKAGVSAAELTAFDIELDICGGVMVYEVEFEAGAREYECKVHAVSGEIVEFESETEDDSRIDQQPAADEITAEKAKEIAFNHAGVKASETVFIKCERDFEDGCAVYEIEFAVPDGSGYTEYTYEIVASDGRIAHVEREFESTVETDKKTAAVKISLEKAKEIALNHAGVSVKNTVWIKGKLDADDGAAVYDIEFRVGEWEFDYEIHAETGEILEAEKETDD